MTIACYRHLFLYVNVATKKETATSRCLLLLFFKFIYGYFVVKKLTIAVVAITFFFSYFLFEKKKGCFLWSLLLQRRLVHYNQQLIMIL